MKIEEMRGLGVGLNKKRPFCRCFGVHFGRIPRISFNLIHQRRFS